MTVPSTETGPKGPHRGRMLLLFMHAGAPALLGVGMLFQGVENVVGQFQIHSNSISNLKARRKLPEEEEELELNRSKAGQR